MNIGEKISILRKKSGLNQKALADKAGLTQATISRIEKDKGGVRELRATALKKLANALDVTVDYLVGDSTQISPPDLIKGDPRAEGIVLAYNQFSQSERDALINFVEALKQSGVGIIIDKPIAKIGNVQADGVLEEDQILYKIIDVTRNQLSLSGIPHIEYVCRASFQKFPKGTEIEVKRNRNITIISTKDRDAIRGHEVEITSSQSHPAGYNVDEPQILKNAIEKALKKAREKLI